MVKLHQLLLSSQNKLARSHDLLKKWHQQQIRRMSWNIVQCQHLSVPLVQQLLSPQSTQQQNGLSNKNHHWSPSSLRSTFRCKTLFTCGGGLRKCLPAVVSQSDNRKTHIVQQKRYVSGDTFARENSHVASAIRRMVEASPDITLQVERINLVGCNNLLPYQLENCINRSIVRIKVLTHVDTISEEALRHQLAYIEEQERLKFPPSSNKFPTAIIAVNLTAVDKPKELRLLQDCIFGATQVVHNNQIWVCGSPNSGKSSLILPLTRERTMTVRNKKAYHLPKISQRAGMTLGIKKHVMVSNPLSTIYHLEATLHDMPGLRPRMDDSRTPAALMFAARVTETFPNYQELCHNDLILQLQLEACNRHDILTKQYAHYIQEAKKAKSSSTTSVKSASASQLQPPPSQEPPSIDISNDKNPLQYIKPNYVGLFQLTDGATNDPRVLRTAANKVIPACTDKKIMTKFHNFDCGGNIFTPNHKHHATLINHSVNMRFHFGSPIIYMNDAAVRLVDVHHGRVTAFDPSSSKSFMEEEGNDDDLEVEVLEDFESHPRKRTRK